MTGDLRIAVIGAGGIGRAHLRAYRSAGVTPVAVADVNPVAATALADEAGGQAFDDAGTMLRTLDLDAVSICTPPSTHEPLAVQSLEAGVAVLCEKPMARTVEECDTMIKAAEANRCLLTVGFCHRFQPEIEAMRAVITDGGIGTVLSFRNRFSGPLVGVESTWFSRPEISGGGVLMDTCVHSVDIFRHLIGEIDQVRALTATTSASLQVEDTAALTLRSVDGTLGVIEASWRTAPGEAVVTVSGTQGRLQLDYTTMIVTRTDTDGRTTKLEVPAGDRFTRQAEHFLRCVGDGARPKVSPADGARAIAVLQQAYASAEQS